MRSVALIISLSLSVFSWTQSKLLPTEYVQYIINTKNQRTDSVSFDKMDVKLVQTPIEYYVASAFLEGAITQKEAKKMLKEKQTVTFFGMLIQTKEGGLFDQSSWTRSDQMKFYSIDFKSKVKAISTKGDTVDCQNFIFQAGAAFGNYAYFEFEIPLVENEIKELIFLAQPIQNSIFSCGIKPKNHKPKVRLKIKK